MFNFLTMNHYTYKQYNHQCLKTGVKHPMVILNLTKLI